MRLTRHLGIGIAAVLTGWAAPCPASAEAKLTDFCGKWSGIGTDRKENILSLDSPQQTNCTTTVQADPSGMTSETDCHGEGLRKKIVLSITLNGNQISGDLCQTTNGGDPENGKVLGRRTGDTAKFQVEISVVKYATVDLKLLTPSSYLMHVDGTKLGVTMPLMHVEFDRKAPGCGKRKAIIIDRHECNLQ